MVKLVDTADLKSAASRERACRFDSGSGHHRIEDTMSSYNTPFEIHVHGDVLLRNEVDLKAVQEALKPLWKYAGARSLTEGAQSLYEEEPGIRFDANEHRLQLCWTVRGNEDFRQVLDDMCMNINEVSAAGAQIEVTFYDTEYDEEDEERGTESRDDFIILFVGPDPACSARLAGTRRCQFDGAPF